MSMDVATRKKYEAWKRRRVLNYILFLVLGVLVVWAGFLLGSSRNDREEDGVVNPTETNYLANEVETEPVPTETDGTVSGYITEEPDIEDRREPVVFCGAAEPDDATVLTTEEAMSYLALVNRCYRMADQFSPSDLTVVNVPGVNFPGNGIHELRETAARALEAMFQEAGTNGLEILMSSGYRDFNLQTFFYERQIEAQGGDVEAARRISAVPGHSEHQLGLGVDLTTPALEVLGWLHSDFSATPEGIWVRENAHRFGFIVSFPYGREADVAIIYEPWHIRYVGVDSATVIFENGLILEEYLWYFH